MSFPTRLPNRPIKFISIVLIFGVTALTFQNCAKPVNPTAKDIEINAQIDGLVQQLKSASFDLTCSSDSDCDTYITHSCGEVLVYSKTATDLSRFQTLQIEIASLESQRFAQSACSMVNPYSSVKCINQKCQGTPVRSAN